VDINRSKETTEQNYKISPEDSLGYHEPKQHEQWINKECGKLLHQSKQAELQDK
jgi:hypothetical protein